MAKEYIDASAKVYKIIDRPTSTSSEGLQKSILLRGGAEASSKLRGEALKGCQ